MRAKQQMTVPVLCGEGCCHSLASLSVHSSLAEDKLFTFVLDVSGMVCDWSHSQSHIYMCELLICMNGYAGL